MIRPFVALPAAQPPTHSAPIAQNSQFHPPQTLEMALEAWESEDGASCVTQPSRLSGGGAVDQSKTLLCDTNLDPQPEASTATMSRPSTPTHLLSNGVYANSTPGTPNHNFALTEYAANPSPSTGSLRGTPETHGVPDAFLLPNGTPDVRLRASI
jgi:hypothetical protein